MSHRKLSSRIPSALSLMVLLSLPFASWACGGDENQNPSGGGGSSGGSAGTGGTGGTVQPDASDDASAGHAGGDGDDACKYVEEITNKVYVCFVIHNEEDDANGVPSSALNIPDYNDDEAVFTHFAGSMFRYAQMLSSLGAKLSFQPDWTFTEGVDRYERDLFKDLVALGNVEVVPHAHESIVAYDELFLRLESLNAEPGKILGGMTFDAFLAKQSWFDANPGYRFWSAPTASVGHVDDRPSPPFVYRIAMPNEVSTTQDLYWHRANSPLVVSPGLPSNTTAMFQFKPEGRFVTPSYFFHATREFLAEPSDTSVPEAWRKRTDGSKPLYGENMTAQELIEATRQRIESELLPLVAEGKVEFATVGEILSLYEKNETCLDLNDGMDLSVFVP